MGSWLTPWPPTPEIRLKPRFVSEPPDLFAVVPQEGVGKLQCLIAVLNEQQVMDVFGFAYNGQKYPVKLEMSMKEYLLLKTQYPLIAPFVKYESGKDKYVLEVEVNDVKPVEYFLKHLKDWRWLFRIFTFEKFNFLNIIFILLFTSEKKKSNWKQQKNWFFHL